MANAEKVSAVSAIAESFRGSSAAVLTEYRGLTVAELTELRRALGDGVDYAVVKNTLTRIAARDAGLDGLGALLTGPTAVAFVSGDPVEAAKGLRDFARTHPLLVVKGGVMEGRALSADEVRRLADLESREVLLARLAGAMLGSLSQAVSLFAAPLAQVARLAEALRQKAEAEPGILRGAGPESAAAPVAAEYAPEAAAGEAATAGEAPAGDDPAGYDPAGGGPAGGGPAGGGPAGGGPAAGDPAAGDPAGGDPAPEAPAGEQPFAGSDPTATGQVPTADTGDPDGPSETPVVPDV